MVENNKNKPISYLIDYVIEGYEWYFLPKTGSLWLINPNTKQWLLDYENTGNLWYFRPRWSDYFKYLNMGPSEYQQYIQAYVEDVLRNGVRNIHKDSQNLKNNVEYVLRNGEKL